MAGQMGGRMSVLIISIPGRRVDADGLRLAHSLRDAVLTFVGRV